MKILRLIKKSWGRDFRQKATPKKTLSYYRSAPAPARSPFVRKPQPRARRLLARTLDFLVIVIILAGIAYNLLVRSEPKIALNSTALHSTETYRQAVVSALKGLKNRNKLTFDKKGLTTELKQQFPEISNVTVELPLFGQVPSIRLSIAKPSLVLKGAEGTIGAAERLIVDAKGTLIGSQQNFPSVKDLPLITDETGFVANIGQPILSLSDVSFILNVLAQAEKAKVPIASLTLPKLAQELDLRTSDRNYFVKLYLGGDALLQAGQFLAARAQFDKQNSQPSQYLDVRVPGKIYFK